MVLHSRITLAREALGVQSVEDWAAIRPEEILAVDGCGLATLDEIRYWLAGRGLTLQGDLTPEYWHSLAKRVRIGAQLGDEEQATVVPFTVLVDSAEQLPWTFAGLKTWRRGQDVPLIVPTRRKKLGESYGDYSIDGLEQVASIERKSCEDAQSTILGWYDGRRENFTETLETLAGLRYAAVVVEATLGHVIATVPARGRKSAAENAKISHRQVLAWLQDYRVPWLFCDSRRMAEASAFRILERAWRNETKQKKRRSKTRDQTEIL
jgi:hypothetical protein